MSKLESLAHVRTLTGAGYTQLKQFSEVKEADLLQLHGVGKKAIDILCATLAENGLSLAD
jgi:hypothetical protein